MTISGQSGPQDVKALRYTGVLRDSERSSGGVLLIGPLPPPPLVGGLETGVHLLVTSRLAQRVSMRLFNTARSPDPTRPILQKLVYQVTACLRFAGTVVRLRPRIVHVKTVSNLNFYQNAVYTVLARLLGCRVVLQIHGGGFPEFYGRGGHIQKHVISRVLRLPNLLVALSEGWASYFVGVSGRQHVVVIPNGAETEEFRSRVPERARFGIDPGRTAVLFLGTRAEELDVLKGLDELIEAVRIIRQRHPGILLVTAGNACRERLSRCLVLGAQGEGWCSVGVVQGDQKVALYRSVDIFALPSRYENMPNTLIEAMAAGLPAVGSSVGAIPEMIEDGSSGFVIPPRDTHALADRLELLLADPDLRLRMGGRAAQIARERYDLSLVESRLLDAYIQLDARVVGDAPLPGGTSPLPRASIRWFRRAWVQRKTRVLGRLCQMSPAESLHRLHRLAIKHIRRLGLRRLRSTRPVRLPAHMEADPVAYLCERTTARGFLAANEVDGLVDRARAELSGQTESVIRQSDLLLTEGIELLGNRFCPADAHFDWLADPDRGRLWPQVVMDDRDAVCRVAADVKFVWEVNRHQFLVTLARASRYSRDARYGRACVAMIERWIDANPLGIGVNWASNLEVAVRSLSWVWTIHFLLGTSALENRSLRSWLVSLRQHRNHLATHLSTYTDPTNHLIGEAAALAVLAIWLPEWEDGGAPLRHALATLERELARQVGDDGWDREQSTSYQRFVLDLVLQVIAIAERNAIPLPATIRAKAGTMVRALREIIGSTGRAPRIGDSDDARGLPFFTDDQWDFAEIIALGEAVLGHHQSDGSGKKYESVFWVTAGGVSAARPEEPRAATQRASVLLGDAGYAVLRSAVDSSDRLLFDCGTLGYPPHASHGHADLLSVLLDLGGEEVLIDPGTFAYYDESGRRNLFRSTRSHNTVEVGGRDQADPFDTFKWLNLPRCSIDEVFLTSDFDYVEAWHDGYQRLKSPVRHRRAVVRVASCWLLIDWLEGNGLQHFARHFHAPPRVRLDRLDSSTARLVPPSGRRALVIRDLRAEHDPPSSMTCTPTAPYSERYGHLSMAPALTFADFARLPTLRVTLLACRHDDATRSPTSARIISGGRAEECVRLALETNEETLEVHLRVAGGTGDASCTTEARTRLFYKNGTRSRVLEAGGPCATARSSCRLFGRAQQEGASTHEQADIGSNEVS